MKLDEVRVIGVLGDIHTGKSSLTFNLLKEYKGDRKIYLFGYPIKTKNLVKMHDWMEGYKEVSSIKELTQIRDAIIFMDELQKHIKFYQRRTADDFLELLSTMAHNGNTIIFTTPMSQYITKSLDCFIDGFVYTRIKDLATLKNGSKAKRSVQEFSNAKINKWSLALKNGEFLEIVDINDPSENGIKDFPNLHIGKHWGIK